MISITKTFVLVCLVFAAVPEAWAAPVGNRLTSIKMMRRMVNDVEAGAPPVRRHYSSVSVVAREPALEVPPAAPVVARAGAPQVEPPKKTEVRRRHHAKNEARSPSDAPKTPRVLPRFKRDESQKKRSPSGPVVVERKDAASDSNVAREHLPQPTATAAHVARAPMGNSLPDHTSLKQPTATPVPVAKREPEVEKREPIKPIMIFRRAMELD